MKRSGWRDFSSLLYLWVESHTLHGFGDVSLKAYCAVIYFVCEADNGIHTVLLTSKTRASLMKSQTIPNGHWNKGCVR